MGGAEENRLSPEGNSLFVVTEHQLGYLFVLLSLVNPGYQLWVLVVLAVSRYTALKMGSVTVTGSTEDPGFDFGLSGTLDIDALDYNSFDAAQTGGRLDWASAFDLDGDGDQDAVDLSAQLGLAAGTLAIDLPEILQFALAGSVTATPLITAGPVRIGGAVDFALTRLTVDVDSDGNGAADLIGARLDVLALSVTNASVEVDGVATLTLSGGQLALARVTAASSGSVMLRIF